jgi:hypothetical protein
MSSISTVAVRAPDGLFFWKACATSLEPRRVDGPKGIPLEILDHFENGRPLAFPGLGFGMLAAELRQPEGVTHVALYRRGKS